MTRKDLNEDGVGYDLFMITIFTLVALGLLLVINFAYGEIILVINPLLEAGEFSESSLLSMQLAGFNLTNLVIASLIGMFIFSVRRGLMNGAGEGTFQAMAGSWVLMVAFTMLGFLMALVAGIYLDMALIPTANAIVNSGVNASSEWLGYSESYGGFFISCIRFLTWIPQIIGIAMFWQSAFKVTSGDRYY